MQTRRPTSADVAARAGVSRATVSYVLNGSTRHTFPQETRDRILAAAAEIGYTPNAAARALRRGTSGVVLLVLRDLPVGSNLTRLLAELTAAVSATGRSLVTWTADAGPTLRDALGHLDPLAVLVTTPLPDDDLAAVRSAGITVLAVPTGRPVSGESTAPVESERRIGALQVEHLVSAGHRLLGVVTTADPRLAPFAANRLEGALTAARDRGLPEPRVLSLPGGDDPVAGEPAVALVAAALREWTGGPARVTGIACYNDLHAAAVLAGARRVGLPVPAGLSVIGIDDEPLAPFLDPPLTTVHFDFRDAVAHAVASLAAAVDGGTPPPAPIRPAAVLVVRGSVGPPDVGPFRPGRAPRP